MNDRKKVSFDTFLFWLIDGTSAKNLVKSENTDTGVEYWQKYFGVGKSGYSSSSKKGLPGLCSVLPPAPNIGVLCCTAARTLYIVSYTVQPLLPPSVNYLRLSADLPLFSV